MPYADPEKKKAYDRAYTNPEPEKKKVRDRAYGKAHAATRDARVKAWNAAHPEEAHAGHLKRQARYHAKHTKECLRRTRAWKKANPDKVQALVSKRHAQQMHAPINDLTAAQWISIKEVYGYRCVYCGCKPKRLTKDHIIPLSKGGSHTFSNIVPACRSCNSKKGAGAPLVPVQPLLLVS